MGSANEETLRFLLLGKTGSGKSSTGNTILGQDLFDADVSFISVTDDCQLKSASNHGVTLEVMDCPGLFDTKKSNHDVATDVMTAFSSTSAADVICYVIELGAYTEEDFRAYQRLTAMLDDGFTKHLLVLFTKGDYLKNKTIQTMLNEAPDCLKTVLHDCSDRYIVFNNMSPKKQDQVQQLIEMARAMKTQNGGSSYTCPAYTNIRDEISARFSQVDEIEASKSVYAKHVRDQIEKTKKSANAQRDDLARKTLESQEEAKMKEAELQVRVDDLSGRLSQQKASCSSVATQLEVLQSRQVQEQQQREQERQQLQAQHAAAIQQKNNEIASVH